TTLFRSPTAVQGREATAQIVRALQLADRQGFDAIILARGGGSLEDLWCFNEEAVARALAACVTPTVSAVGHETDVSISDFVADVRAPTPSAAAELLAPHSADLQQRLAVLERRLQLCMRQQLHREQLRLEGLLRRLRHPAERLPRAMQAGLRQRRLQLGAMAQTLQVVSPLATLGRGYSILLDEKGHAIRSADQTRVGQRLEARLGEGRLSVRVEDNHLEPVNLSLLD